MPLEFFRVEEGTGEAAIAFGGSRRVGCLRPRFGTGCEAAAEPMAPELEPQFARSASAPAHRVTAGGQVDYSTVPGFENYGPEIYGFTASVDGNGNARGELVTHWGKQPDGLRGGREFDLERQRQRRGRRGRAGRPVVLLLVRRGRVREPVPLPRPFRLDAGERAGPVAPSRSVIHRRRPAESRAPPGVFTIHPPPSERPWQSVYG